MSDFLRFRHRFEVCVNKMRSAGLGSILLFSGYFATVRKRKTLRRLISACGLSRDADAARAADFLSRTGRTQPISPGVFLKGRRREASRVGPQRSVISGMAEGSIAAA